MTNKTTKIGIRINELEKEQWNYYAISIGYDSLSEFIRDSINGLIKEAKKPKKQIIIVDNLEGKF